MVTVWFVVTEPAVAVKVAVVEPAGTVTEAGTVRAALLSLRLTAVPPVEAARDRVTVHEEVAPDETDVGEHCRLEIVRLAGGVTVSENVLEEPLRVAVEVTEPAVAVNAAAVEPAGTVTDAGTVKAELLSVTATVVPPVGAARESVTVHEEVVPDGTEVGEHCKFESVMGDCVTVMAPPVPAIVIGIPVGEAA
jgi:hypothetical protein